MKSNFYKNVRAVLLLSFLLLFGGQIFAQQYLTKINGWNAYVHLPDDYNDGTGKTYPLICFVPGTGECGTDASKLLVNGPSKFVASGSTMQFTVNGKVEKPIVISIQPINLWPNAYTLNLMLDSITKRFRCDLQRINVTGLSMGGWSWDNFVDNYSSAYTSRITSIVSMSAPEPDNLVTNMRFYALGGGTAWFFEGNQDLRGNDKIRDTMNYYVAGSARYTLYNGGHCCWNTFYNPTWTENGESIYTWMLKQKKELITGALLPPQADAGQDSTTLQPLANYSLNGYGNDPNGLPIFFSWTKISGPAAGSITNPGSATSTVSGLTTGTYKFKLVVSNSLGLIGTDTLAIYNGVLGPLPVTLTGFSANVFNKTSVFVQWKTTNEINADYFLVERSNNAQSFVQQTKVFSKVANGFGATYNFTDAYPSMGTNYYRLKMVDKDGKYEYSNVISINFSGSSAGNGLAISSINSSTNLLGIKINSSKMQPANIVIVDAVGRTLYADKVSLIQGLNDLSKNVVLLPGIYYLNVITDDKKEAKGFIK